MHQWSGAVHKRNESPNPTGSKRVKITSDKTAEICRICWDGHKPNDPLVSPCACSGSLCFVHTSCLFIGARAKDTVESYSSCFTCKQQYTGKVGRSLREACVQRMAISYGIDHWQTVEAANLLLESFPSQKEVAESGYFVWNAKQWFAAVVKYDTMTFGVDHVETLHSKNLCAVLLHQEGQYAEARSLYKDVLECYIWKLGADHTKTVRTKYDLALALQMLGEIDEAQRLQEVVVQGYTRHHGVDDIRTLEAKRDLAGMLLEQGDVAEAHRLYDVVLQGFTYKLGADCLEIIDVKCNYLHVLHHQRKFAEERRVCEEVLEGYTKKLGADHSHALLWRSVMAGLLYDQGQVTKAYSLYQDILECCTRRFGADHSKILEARRQLDICLKEQGEVAEARSQTNHPYAIHNALTKVLSDAEDFVHGVRFPALKMLFLSPLIVNNTCIHLCWEPE